MPGRDVPGGDRVVTSATVHDYPAGRFAVWATAWLTGRASYDEALDAILGDSAHRVVGLPGTTQAVPLGWALSALRGLGEQRLRLVLPVPGDVRGLAAVPGLAALALGAGQAAVGDRVALVPVDLGPEAATGTAVSLPADHDPVARSVLGRAQRMARVRDLAMADAPGAAVTHAQAAARDDALRPRADAVRGSSVAAYNSVPR